MKLDLKEWINKVSKGIAAKVWTFSDTVDRTWSANAYIAFPTASPTNYDDSTVTYSSSGLITFNKSGTFIVNAHIPIITTTGGRGYVRLKNYGANLDLAYSIAYGTFVTCTITKILQVSSGTRIGIQCVEALRINAGGLAPTYIQITEVGG